jgi:hypothetical protein
MGNNDLKHYLKIYQNTNGQHLKLVLIYQEIFLVYNLLGLKKQNSKKKTFLFYRIVGFCTMQERKKKVP